MYNTFQSGISGRPYMPLYITASTQLNFPLRNINRPYKKFLKLFSFATFNDPRKMLSC